MSDYIKREDAKEYLYNFASKEFHKRDMVFAGRLTAIQIKDVPSVDFAQVRHGEWKFDNETDSFFCSECNAEALLKCVVCGGCIQELSDYCPNCGAFMDKDGDKDDD